MLVDNGGLPMAKSDALRRLSRRIPTSPEVEAIIANLRRDTDIAVAIVGSALVESALERLLISKFATKRKELLGRLFQNEGPMSNFHGKILVAQAFGVITSPLADEMHKIRAIRNAFAHAKVPISFENEVVLREVTELKFASILAAIFRSNLDLPLDGKGSFLWAVQMTLILFEEFEKRGGRAQMAIDAIREEIDKEHPEDG